MPGNVLSFRADRYELIEVAQGKRPADVFLRNGNILNVYSGEILEGNVAIRRDRFAYVGTSEAAIGEDTLVIDADGQYVSPGFIETHAHPWVVYNPVSLTEKVLPLGTTTILHDDLFAYLHLGVDGVRKMIEDLRALPGLHFWLARIVSQADYDGERDDFAPERLAALLELPDVIGTAEVTRWPLLYEGDPFAIETIERAKRLGKLSDGHTAGCSYERLNSIVASGISACHESITVQEILDRLRLGMWTVMRHSSLRPDLPELIKAVTEHRVSTSRLMMTTDGPHPAFIDEEGYVDGLLRTAVQEGVPPLQALQMVTINAATYMGLDEMLGGIAPGRRADVLLLPDLETFRPSLVISGGQVVAREGKLTATLPAIDWSSYPDKMPITVGTGGPIDPGIFQYRGAPGDGECSVPVMQFKIAVITARRDETLPVKDGVVDISSRPSLAYGALLDRAGKWVSHAIIDHFLGGAEGFASSYNTTTHILGIGRDPRAIAEAARRVSALGGGIVLVEQGKAVLEIPLPLAGMMTTSPSFETAVRYQEALLAAVKERGYPFHDILYSLLFLTCDFLPGLRLTSQGLIDVKNHEVLHPSIALDR